MKITFIQTGGTIDKDYPRSQGGYAFEITRPAVERILKVLNPAFEFEVIPLLQKDSLDLTGDDRDRIHDACIDSGSTKMIITHGTDTMIETAQRLSHIENKTIILTGAMKPEKFKDSDASANIGVAIGAVQTMEPGTYIVMHGQLFAWDRVSRDPETGRFIEK